MFDFMQSYLSVVGIMSGQSPFQKVLAYAYILKSPPQYKHPLIIISGFKSYIRFPSFLPFFLNLF